MLHPEDYEYEDDFNSFMRDMGNDPIEAEKALNSILSFEKALQDFALARKQAVAKDEKFGTSARDVMDALEKINKESFEVISRYIEYGNGSLVPAKYLELRRMTDE